MSFVEHKAEIVKAYQEGKTLDQVAREYGCCITTVSNLLMALGVPTRPKTSVEKEKLIVSLIKQGVKNIEISKRVGCSLAVIYHIKQRNSLKIRPMYFMTEDDVRKAMVLYEEGNDLKQVGKLLGYSSVAIRNHLMTINVHIRTRREAYHLWKTKLNPNHIPGRRITTDGYVLIYKPDHPKATKHGDVREHRLVAEQMLGRQLTDDEIPHHLNGIKDDNRPENLCVLTLTTHAGQMRLKDLYIKELQKRIRQLETELKQRRLL